MSENQEHNESVNTAVDAVVARARKAQAEFEGLADQKLYDTAALAAGWAIMEEENNRMLAEMAVEATGLGNVPDKIIKNRRKTLGLLRDIKGVQTTGVSNEDPAKGITEILRPVGVVGAVVPSTNPAATPANNIINALKCGNAIILAPSPKGASVCRKLLELIHANFKKAGINPDLVQSLPEPVSKAATSRLMATVDLLVVTGSQDNVRRAYSSGTPALGVGAGNVSVIVDETADLKSAAEKITASKTFDNSTSCSSENNLIILEAVYESCIQELCKAGAYLPEPAQAAEAAGRIRPDGRLNGALTGKGIGNVMQALGLPMPVGSAPKYVLLPTDDDSRGNPLCDEKMSLVVSVFKAADFQHAQQIARRIFACKGAGHSIGIHTNDYQRPVELGKALPTCRVIVNQAHCFATGGAFNNGMPFSLSMGCGSWGGNSIGENLHYKHFLNRTVIVRTIPEQVPSLDEIFEDYWRSFGR